LAKRAFCAQKKAANGAFLHIEKPNGPSPFIFLPIENRENPSKIFENPFIFRAQLPQISNLGFKNCEAGSKISNAALLFQRGAEQKINL